MHVVITDPTSNEVLMSRELRDDEALDPAVYAREWAKASGVEVEETGGWVPDWSGDIRVELREDPANTVVIWNAANYFLIREES